jgi:biopolymer transport protein ExbD
MRMVRGRGSSRPHPEEESLINLTPLIDVVFVVLIMFILVAPMLELDRVELASKGNSQIREITPAQEQSSIAIHVLRDNTILLNGKKMQSSELTEQLTLLHRKFPNKYPQLFHDRQAYFETYQAVKTAAENAGFEELDVILKP